MQASAHAVVAAQPPTAPLSQRLGSRRSVGRGRLAIAAAKDKTEKQEMTGVVFKPFEEVAPVLASTAGTASTGSGGADPRASFARLKTFDVNCEAAINEQVNIEYNISYVYHSMSCFFDRDTVSLPGFASWFRRNSLEEREHAQKLIDLQNTRGGRVKLGAITMPETEYEHAEKGDALYAMELALSLEKLNFDKLLHLWEVVDAHGDPQLTQYVEDMMQDQSEDIKVVADYVSQLRRVGKGHGVWAFDHELYEEEIRARATSA